MKLGAEGTTGDTQSRVGSDPTELGPPLYHRETNHKMAAALKVLSALDDARTQHYHFKAAVIAGTGLFTEAYELFCIPPIIKLIGRIYYVDQWDNYKIPAAVVSALVAISLLGTGIGQLVFGSLGDRIGRRRLYGLTLALMVVSCIECGFSICGSRSCVLVTLGLFRFLLGVGIGGDYPLSATIMSEFANKRTRGAFMAAVFSMQDLGILASSVVTVVVCAAFQRISDASKFETPKEADLAWRLILMLGAFPLGISYYWRMTMPETPRYTALVDQNALQAAEDVDKVLDVSVSQIAEEFEFPPNPPSYSFLSNRRFRRHGQDLFTSTSTFKIPPNPPSSYPLISKQFLRRHGRDLFACAITWFLVDIVFHSSNLFQSQIYKRYLRDKSEMNAYEEAFNVAAYQAIFATCSTIPGYWTTIYVIDRIGRVKIQVLGFFVLAIVYLALGTTYFLYWNRHTNIGFMFLYGLSFFFSSFGPKTTTFIVPAELFPARFRSTCHGISGAAGKLGAIIGSVVFLRASQGYRENGYAEGTKLTASLVILGGICAVGMVVTYFFTRETKGRSLEENEDDDENEGPGLLRCFTKSTMQPHSSPNEAVAGQRKFMG